MKEVQETLGHANLAITSDTCTSVILELQRANAAAAASRLGLSQSTVGSYIDRLRIKCANVGRPAQTKATLVARAIQDGLIGLDDL